MIPRLPQGSSYLGFIVGSSVASTLALLAIYKLTLSPPKRIISSPKKTQETYLSPAQKDALPYPPDILPGARDVASPYGSIRVYEWGPETGRRVLLVHGISTPCIALSGIAEGLVEKGCRVILFDLFGRGYSDSVDLPHDTRLYATQILLAITSSPIAWTPGGFSVVGYSLGGGIAADFASSFPEMVKSVVLLAPSGLIRPVYFGWQHWVMYSGLLTDSLLQWIVKGRLGGTLAAKPVTKEGTEENPSTGDELKGNRDPKFEAAVLMQSRPEHTIADVVQWQLTNHEGFVRSFVSSMRHSAVAGPRPLWRKLGERQEKVLVLAGNEDGVILAPELRADFEDAVGGPQKVDFRLVEGGGHEFPLTHAEVVVREVSEFWGL